MNLLTELDQSIDIEVDEMWSFVHNKKNKIWIWIAYHRETKQILAWIMGDRSAETLDNLLELLSDFKINIFYTDGLHAYRDRIPQENHVVGKTYTQGIERANLTLRLRCKRLVRKTICYSKSLINHGLFFSLIVEKWFYLNKENFYEVIKVFENNSDKILEVGGNIGLLA